MTEEQIEAAYTAAMVACLQGFQFAHGYTGDVCHDIIAQQRATAADGITALKTLYESYKALRADYVERLRALAPSACIADAQKMGYLKAINDAMNLCFDVANQELTQTITGESALRILASILQDRGIDMAVSLAKTETVVQ